MKRKINKTILAVLKKEEKKIFNRALYFALFVAAIMGCIASSTTLLIESDLKKIFMVLPITLGVLSLVFLLLFFLNKIDVAKFEKILKLSITHFENTGELKRFLIKENLLNDSEFLELEQKNDSKWKESKLFAWVSIISRVNYSYASFFSSANKLRIKNIDEKWNELQISSKEESENVAIDLHSTKKPDSLKYNILWHFYTKSFRLIDIKLGLSVGCMIYGTIAAILIIPIIIFASGTNSLGALLIPLFALIIPSIIFLAINSLVALQMSVDNRFNFLMTLDLDDVDAKIFLNTLIKNSIVSDKKVQKLYDVANIAK